MTVVLNHDRCAIVHGRALETSRLFAAKTFDLVVTDPPYSAHVHAMLGKERRTDGHAARAELEFPPIDDEAIAAYAEQWVRVCRGWILIFSDFYKSATWGRALERAGGAWVRTGAWVKTSPMPQMTGDRPACGHEDIVIGHATPKGWGWNGKGHAAIWRGPRDSDAMHPNQKPAWLIQSLLGMFAPAGGSVFDPFLGSGTTAYAALASERIVGEISADTGCRACLRKRAEEYAPPLPQNLCVLGVDGDRKWADYAAARITPLLQASIAA